MSKLLILLVVIGVALWWLSGRRRAPPPDASPRTPPPAPPPAEPQPMLACAHCGVHLPRDEALCDPAGRAFCSESHRLKGPH